MYQGIRKILELKISHPSKTCLDLTRNLVTKTSVTVIGVDHREIVEKRNPITFVSYLHCCGSSFGGRSPCYYVPSIEAEVTEFRLMLK